MKEKTLKALRTAWKRKELTLYLGAGVSIANGLPTWERLILAMYFAAISEQRLGGWRPFSNYLFAIAEWNLEMAAEPLEITARKLAKFYPNSQDFKTALHRTLYGGLTDRDGQPLPEIDASSLRRGNSTLDSVARLCSESSGGKGIRSVITYNYDDLLELSLGSYPHQSIFGPTDIDDSKLPVYHVHGLVPFREPSSGSRGDEIVFTEDQYNRVAADPYNWSSIVQLQSMTGSVGVMVGLSLSDRNIRRLLDAVREAPVTSKSYALLKTPDTEDPEDTELDDIHHTAMQYYSLFKQSGVKAEKDFESGISFSRPGVKSAAPTRGVGRKGPRYRHEISGILREIRRLDKEQQQYVLRQLGIECIWYEDHSEIPDILASIVE